MDLSAQIMEVQRAVGVTPDGVAGKLTWAAISRALGVKTDEPTPSSPNGFVFDSRTEANLAGLTPATQRVAREFLRALLDRSINAKIISGTRTYDEQNALYEQGRTKPGRVVTNARAGYSNHNFGIAFDLGLFDTNGRYLEDSPLYHTAGLIGKGFGLSWGGDWHFQDEPHFELRPDWAADLSEHDMLAKLREIHDDALPA